MEIDIGPNGEGLQEAIRELSKGACKVKIIGRKEQQRTLPQNAAIHKYCAMLAEALNDAGLDMKTVLKPDAEIPWTQENIKINMWHEVQLAMFPDAVDKDGKPSTAALSKEQVGQVYETISRYIAQSQGVSVPFPDRWGN